jgi:hypothetical protein
MTISAWGVNGDEEEDRMATKSTKGTEVKNDKDILALCDRIRQISFDLHTSPFKLPTN